MLEKLVEILDDPLPRMLDDPGCWGSLIVNLRKPHTYRVFAYVGDLRICLHRFELCDEEEAFAHPHPWPAAFIVLHGHYRQKIWSSADRETKRNSEPLVDMILGPKSMYSITNPLTWHSVQPVQTIGDMNLLSLDSHAITDHYPPSAFSIMVNDKPWDKEVVHAEAPRTAGKDLDKMTPPELRTHLDTFNELWHLHFGLGDEIVGGKI